MGNLFTNLKVSRTLSAGLEATAETQAGGQQGVTQGIDRASEPHSGAVAQKPAGRTGLSPGSSRAL